MIVHLIDGTYELFRHFYGLRRATGDKDRRFGAVTGVLNTMLQMFCLLYTSNIIRGETLRVP